MFTRKDVNNKYEKYFLVNSFKAYVNNNKNKNFGKCEFGLQANYFLEDYISALYNLDKNIKFQYFLKDLSFYSTVNLYLVTGCDSLFLFLLMLPSNFLDRIEKRRKDIEEFIKLIELENISIGNLLYPEEIDFSLKNLLKINGVNFDLIKGHFLNSKKSSRELLSFDLKKYGKGTLNQESIDDINRSIYNDHALIEMQLIDKVESFHKEKIYLKSPCITNETKKILNSF